jgi:hypothetical protein
MSATEWVTLAIAVLGVLHGPLTGQLLAALKKSPPSK